MEEKLISIIIISLVSIMLIAFLVYSIISTINNSKIDDVYSVDELKNFTIKYSFKEQSISFYLRESKTSYQYSTEEFINLIQESKQEEFKEWVKSAIESDEEIEESFTTEVSDLGAKGTSMILRFSFYEKTNEDIFFEAEELEYETYKQLDEIKDVVLEDSGNFLNLIKSQVSINPTINFALLYIKFDLYDLVERRFGEELAEMYAKSLYLLMNRLSTKGLKVSHYKGDGFLIYYPLSYRARLFRSNIVKILEYYNKVFYVDKYKFELNPKMGISIYNGFTNDINTLARYAFYACENIKEKRYRFFDGALFNMIQNEKLKTDALKEIAERAEDIIKFNKILNLSDGSTKGYLVEYELSKYPFKDQTDLFLNARNRNMDDRLINALFPQIADKFLTFKQKQSKKIVIFSYLNTFETILDCYEKYFKEEHIGLTIIFRKYDESISEISDNIELLERAKKLKVELGIVSSETMSTTLFKNLKYYKLVVLSKRQIKNMLVDSKSRNEVERIIELCDRMNIPTAGFSLSDYSIAEALRDIGVRFIEGPILENNTSSKISIRQINKLISEKED